jgi:hypothetical protein
MKALLFPLSLCVAVATLSAPATAQVGVHDNSWWRAGGVAINVDVGYVEGQMTLQTSTVNGFTNPTTGTAAEGSTLETPVAVSSGVMTAPDGSQFKASGGIMWRKVNGKWKPMSRTYRRPVPGSMGPHSNGPGQEVVTLPFDAGSAISFEDYRSGNYFTEGGRRAFRYEPN